MELLKVGLLALIALLMFASNPDRSGDSFTHYQRNWFYFITLICICFIAIL